MEQIRNHAKAYTPSIFGGDIDEEPPLKIGTEVFDCTMPSELEFDDEEEAKNGKAQVLKGEFNIFDNKVEEDKSGRLPQEEPQRKYSSEGTSKESQYEMLTRSIVTFTFHKNSSVIYGQPEYAVNSYIPHFLNLKTYPVKFRDESDQLNKGESALKLFWKSVVGYVKVELFIGTATIYLLQPRKEGMLVKAAWSIGDLFKLFSDREERKARLIFRTNDNNQTKLVTRELQEVDLNLLASLIAEAGSSMEITSL